MSYKEVTEIIPYRNLILMQKDKLRESVGDVVKKSSGIDTANRRRKNKGG